MNNTSQFPDVGGVAFPRGGALVNAAPGVPALVQPGATLGHLEQMLTISHLWQTMLRWRLVIIGAAVAGVALGIVVSLSTTPLYRAGVTLEVNSEPTQIIQVGNVQPAAIGDESFIATQIGVLRSRSLAERVARQLNLASNPAIADQALPLGTRQEIATGTVMNGFVADPVRASRLVSLTFSSPDPQIAARVANGYAENFIASNLERRFETTAYARAFLERRIAAVKGKLEQSERQLVNYARAQGIVDLSGSSTAGTGGGSLATSSLTALNDALSQAQVQRIDAEQKLRQAGSSSARAAAVTNSAVQSMRLDLAKLESQYQENLSVYKPDYPAMLRLQQQIAATRANVARESSSLSGNATSSLEADYRTALARERQLQGRVAQLRSSALDLRGRSIQYTILQREVDTNRSLYDGLLQRFKEVGVAGGVGENLISIVDRAQVPGAPYSPRLFLNVLAGLVAGLLLGVGYAFGKEFVDDKIETPDDLEQKLGLRPLGVIPKFGKNDRFVKLISEPRSPVFEAYQSAVTSLRFSTSDGTPKTLLITSSRPSEGKSSSSLALAQAFARSGKRTVLVDADMRMPTFVPDSKDQFGLSNLLTGDTDIDRTIYSAKLENLYFLSSGPIPPNPAELLSGHRFIEVLDELASKFDQVVIDGPPVLGLADAPLLASAVRGVLMVFESGGIRRQVASTALGRLRGAHANVVGAMLTKFNDKRIGQGYGYGYGYEYGYGQGGHSVEPGRRLIDLGAQ
jgi:succinoglycan biosynthesis transport protein ExoP